MTINILSYKGKFRGGNMVSSNLATSWPDAWNAHFSLPWYQAQMDAIASLGGNCVRIIGDSQGVVQGTISQAAYNANLVSLVSYAQSKGLFFFLTYTIAWAFSPSDVTTIGNFIAACALALYPYPNVIGYDLVNEMEGQVPVLSGSGNFTVAQAQAFLLALKGYSKYGSYLPCSASTIVESVADWGNTTAWSVVNGVSDEFSIAHVYVPGLVADGSFIPATGNNTLHLPYFISECGSLQTATHTNQTNFFNGIGAMTAEANCLGSLIWSISDQGSGTPDNSNMGMYSIDGGGILQPRSWIITPFSGWPLNPTQYVQQLPQPFPSGGSRRER